MTAFFDMTRAIGILQFVEILVFVGVAVLVFDDAITQIRCAPVRHMAYAFSAVLWGMSGTVAIRLYARVNAIAAGRVTGIDSPLYLLTAMFTAASCLVFYVAFKRAVPILNRVCED